MVLLEAIGFRCIRVGEDLLLWILARVGVYLTDRVEELESDPILRRRVAIGILDGGDRCRDDDREVSSWRREGWLSCGCAGVTWRCELSIPWLFFG